MFKDLLLKLFGELGEFLKVLFQKGIKDELKLLAPLALAAVKTVAADPSLTSGSAKFDAAFDIVSSGLAGGQKDIANSLVNLAIEIAVQHLNTMTAQAAPGK